MDPCPRARCAGSGQVPVGPDRAAPVGFVEIRLTFERDADAPAEQVARLPRLTERYRVVYQTLRSPARLAVSVASPSG